MPAANPAFADAAAPTLEAVALAAERGDRRLFQGLAFALPPGQLMWLRGRNGRGKTSLLRLLAGLSTPAAGSVHWHGLAEPEAWRQRVLYIAHANALKEDLSVAESLYFLARLQGRAPAAADVAQALARLGLARHGHALVRTLSQGQRRRAVLARLALPQPASVWLLDEPFDALDDEGVAALNALLVAHASRGGSALLTSHQALSLAGPPPQVLDLNAFAAPASGAPA